MAKGILRKDIKVEGPSVVETKSKKNAKVKKPVAAVDVESNVSEKVKPFKKTVRKKKILSRDEMKEVVKYVKAGKEVLVSGSGNTRKYIVFFDGD